MEFLPDQLPWWIASPFSDYSSLRCSLSRINLSAHPRPISRRLRPFHGRLHQPP